MRVEVLRVLDSARGIVFFRCEAGSAPGRWMGEEPAREGAFDVEFEIPEDVTEWVPATAAGLSGQPEAGAEVRIACEVEKCDDSALVARLGPDVLLVDVPGRRSELAAGALISFLVKEVQLYPYLV